MTPRGESDSRVVLVTGAAGVLGRACVSAFAAQGDLVIGHVRSACAAISGADELVVGDLRPSLGQVARIAQESSAIGGRVDVLVNNAASQSIGDLMELTASDWRDMLEASLESAVGLTTALIPSMPPGSAIVNIVSVEVMAAFPAHVHYAAAKAALVAFTRGLAVELAPRGIRANAIAPGLIDRPGLAEQWPTGDAWWRTVSPTGRPVTPDEVAAAVAFLASSSASGITGVTLPVDGGWSASARWTP